MGNLEFSINLVSQQQYSVIYSEEWTGTEMY
jgi:hypothetical protein